MLHGGIDMKSEQQNGKAVAESVRMRSPSTTHALGVVGKKAHETTYGDCRPRRNSTALSVQVVEPCRKSTTMRTQSRKVLCRTGQVKGLERWSDGTALAELYEGVVGRYCIRETT